MTGLVESSEFFPKPKKTNSEARQLVVELKTQTKNLELQITALEKEILSQKGLVLDDLTLLKTLFGVSENLETIKFYHFVLDNLDSYNLTMLNKNNPLHKFQYEENKELYLINFQNTNLKRWRVFGA